MASFRKRGKKWEYRISHTMNGKRESISKGGFDTKTEARAEATKIEHELNAGINVNAGDQLFTDYYKNWIKTYKIGAHSEATDRFYQHANRLVKENFARLTLKEITREEYQEFLNEYSKGRSRETVRKIHVLIGGSLRDAFHDGYIHVNPTHKATIRGTSNNTTSHKYLHEEEAKKLLKALLDGLKTTYTTRYMLLLQFATGARISEIMAITFKDLDFLNNTVNINKSWDYKYTRDFKPTKNHEERKISVDEDTMKLIKDLYDYQLSKKIIDSKQLLFANKGSVPSVAAVNKALKRACRRAEIKEVTSHALRHTYASLLLLNNANVGYISKRLGHRDISVTSDVYSHVLNELEQKSEQLSAKVLKELYTK